MESELTKDYCSDGKSYYQGGKFFPDQTPLEIPLGYQIPETLESMIARMVHSEQIYNNPEVDNVDEADDFDIMDEEPIRTSKHEFTEMQEETFNRDKKAAQQAVDQARKDLDTNQQTDSQRDISEAEQVAKPPLPAQARERRKNTARAGQ